MPSGSDFTPEWKFAINVISPRPLAAFSEWMEERQDRKRKRLMEFAVEVATRSGTSLEDLMARCAASDELSDFAESVLRLAAAEASRRKTVALGRLLALGLGDNTTDIDEAWLILNAVADLQQPHIRVLRRLHDQGTRYQGVLDSELAKMFPNGVALMYPLLKTLERHGLAGPRPTKTDVTPDTAVEWAIWEFGILVLERLFLDHEPEQPTRLDVQNPDASRIASGRDAAYRKRGQI
jgi:hypothetical protein